MMRMVEREIPEVQTFPPGMAPNYNKDNPIWGLVKAMEGVELAAEREHYVAYTLQYLFPFTNMSLYGPSGDQWEMKDPRQQDNKNDFQKQNVRHYELTNTHVVRGYARAGQWAGPFVRLSYSPGPSSPLSQPNGYYRDDVVNLYLKVGDASTGDSLITVPYNQTSHRYEVELWGFPNPGLRELVGPKGQNAIDRGELLARPDLIKGSLGDFRGPDFDQARDKATQEGRAVEMFDYAPEHTMHPIRPLHMEVSWSNAAQDVWDSRDGANYHYEFSMSFRGWSNYLGVGQSPNPHGGVGSLEFRNLYSNYFGYENRRRQALGDAWMSELGRELQPWNIDADGSKPPAKEREYFMAVDYMDLHILKPNCAIGIHRHRDNQELFLMLQGKALMVTGDWCEHEDRERAFEIRTMQPGDLALIKGGQFHALINTLDENVMLFMFGGYD